LSISRHGWELYVVRSHEQHHGSQTRTIGRYQVYRDGEALAGLNGSTAEPGGPGDNGTADCGLRVEAGTYALATQDGDSYCSIGYVTDPDHHVLRKPALKLEATGVRTDILVHPGHGFLASLGCLNLTSDLASADTVIAFEDSRQRVVAMMQDLERYVGETYPSCNGCVIPAAFITIEDAAK
jgi:hypothetical protein